MNSKNIFIMKRIKPSKVPKITTTPEYLARGELKKLYNDTKKVLQVPWMGVVTMAFAQYIDFYKSLWLNIRPICNSKEFIDASINLRKYVEKRTLELKPTSLIKDLTLLNYNNKELDSIKNLLEIFSHGNMPYLLLSTITRLIVEDIPLNKNNYVFKKKHNYTHKLELPIVLIEEHHANTNLKVLYNTIMSKLNIPILNTDYRALARWPSYLNLSWNKLEQQIKLNKYKVLQNDIHNYTVKIALSLGIHREFRLNDIKKSMGTLNEKENITNTVRLFQWLLPSLVINIAFFRYQLND